MKIALAASDASYIGRKAIATGWGTLKEEGKPSCILQEVEVPVISNDRCVSETNYTKKMITDNMLCAGYPGVGQKDSCQVSYLCDEFKQYFKKSRINTANSLTEKNRKKASLNYIEKLNRILVKIISLSCILYIVIQKLSPDLLRKLFSNKRFYINFIESLYGTLTHCAP